MSDANDVLWRYFHAAVKPVLLIMLYFAILLWFCHWLWLYFPDHTWLVIDPHMPPEIRAELSELAKDFASFLNNKIIWNFGRQFNPSASPIFPELLWRMRNTLIFIFFATLSSVIAGGLLATFASLRKPKRRIRKPLTYTYSSVGFLFGLTPLVALVIIYVFCLVLKLAPRAGLISIPLPSSPVEQTLNMLWHLILPTLTITIVNIVRITAMIWSGIPLDSKNPWKIFLFSLSSIDFRLIVPTVIIVEIFFGLPGLGYWLLSALTQMNHPAVIACFIVILAITIGLGCVSTFICALKVKAGINEEIEGSTSWSSKVKRNKEKIKSEDGLTCYFRSKRMIVGLIIVLFFVVVAVAAPLLASYQPESQQYRSPKLATAYAYPEWFTIFPQYRDFNPTINLSPEIRQARIESISGPISVDLDHSFFNFTPSGKASQKAWVVLDLGNFSYPYAPPPSFTMHFTYEMYYNKSRITIYFIIQNYTANPLYAEYFRDPSKAEMKTYISICSVFENQQYIDISVDSFTDNPRMPVMSSLYRPEVPPVDPAQIIFSHKGTYGLKVKVEFESLVLPSHGQLPTAEGAYAHFTLKKIGLTIWGRCYGILGTDSSGRDVWTEVVYGARNALLTSLALAAIAVVLGLPLGFLAGYFKKWMDKIIVVASDTLLFIPIFFIILINTCYSQSTASAALLVLWGLVPMVAISSRNAYITRCNQEGTIKDKVYTFARYTLANLCFTAISVLLLFQTLETIGFGNPNTPTWGRILFDTYYLGRLLAWWIWLPTIALTLLLILGFFLVGSSLDENRL